MRSPPSVIMSSLVGSASQARGAVVVIDVFRAFTTAAIALRNGAEAIVMVEDLETALTLRNRGVGSRCTRRWPGRRVLSLLGAGSVQCLGQDAVARGLMWLHQRTPVRGPRASGHAGPGHGGGRGICAVVGCLVHG